jgi:hypothetical protein
MRKHSLVELMKFHNARNIHAQLDGVNEVIFAHIKLNYGSRIHKPVCMRPLEHFKALSFIMMNS